MAVYIYFIDFFLSCALVGFESKLLATDITKIQYHLYIDPVAVLVYVLQVIGNLTTILTRLTELQFGCVFFLFVCLFQCFTLLHNFDLYMCLHDSLFQCLYKDSSTQLSMVGRGKISFK